MTIDERIRIAVQLAELKGLLGEAYRRIESLESMVEAYRDLNENPPVSSRCDTGGCGEGSQRSGATISGIEPH